MKRLIRALYRIVVCIALLVVGTRASDDLQNIFIGYIYEEPMSPLIQNEDMNLLLELLDDSLDNFASFGLTQTENIRTSHYSCTPSSSTEIHNYDTNQPKAYTEQTGQLSSFYSTVCESGTERLPVYCIPNESVQKHTESVSLGNYAQSNKAKRLKKAVKKNTPRKKQKKTEESTASSSSIDSTDNDVLDSSKINRIKNNISIWNNSRLKNRHRESKHESYKQVVEFNRVGRNIYREIGNKKHQLMIKTYVEHCKVIYKTTPVQNEFWFTIASRSACMHIKHADFRDMHITSSEYKFIEELSGYYPGLPGDIVKFMDKHEPIVSKQESIKTEWIETLGDIHVREPSEPEYGINKETITFEICNEYRLVATAVQMILGLSEMHKDLFNITIEFVEKTLKEETDLNHLKVVRALHKIVAMHKSSNQQKLDEKYAVLCNEFRYILQQEYVSPRFIVINLYAEIYKSITYFYKKAEVCKEILGRKKMTDRKKYYLLAGKCIIKPQKYIKCTTTIDINKLVSEYKHGMEEKTNKWSIPSDIEKHYHIHYVDNTKQQYKRVCMPMYLNQYIHTISQIIEYLKRLFDIEKKECICPCKRGSLRDWMYIQEEERDKTVQEFANCDIVFYYIEEGLRDNYFTFAEFESYIQPQDETICIPLFLSPLMRSAVSMGPFEERGKIKHKLVDSIQYMWMQPSVYTYEEKYKAMKYSHVHHYYSNLYIRRDNADMPTIDCYIMDIKTIISNATATVEWYAKAPNSVDEYTHCILSDNLTNDQGRYNAFSKAVKSQEYTPDSALYGFGLQNSLEKTSEFDDIGYSTDYLIGQNSIANCKLSIVPIHKTPTNSKIADLQSEIYELDREIKHINIEIKKSGTTEEQKKTLRKKRDCTYKMKYKNVQKLKKMQPEDQQLIEEEFSTTSLPICSFLVFRHCNTQTKSTLGAYNEILDVLTRRYTNSGFHSECN